MGRLESWSLAEGELTEFSQEQIDRNFEEDLYIDDIPEIDTFTATALDEIEIQVSEGEL